MIEIIITMGFVLVVISILLFALVMGAKLSKAIDDSLTDLLVSYSRLSRQVADFETPIEGVTIALVPDPSRPAGSPCQLYRLSTKTKAGRVLELDATTQGCLVKDNK